MSPVSSQNPRKRRKRGLFCVLICAIWNALSRSQDPPSLGLSLNIICTVLILLGVESVMEHSWTTMNHILEQNWYSLLPHLQIANISPARDGTSCSPPPPCWDFVSLNLCRSELHQVDTDNFPVMSRKHFPCSPPPSLACIIFPNPLP